MLPRNVTPSPSKNGGAYRFLSRTLISNQEACLQILGLSLASCGYLASPLISLSLDEMVVFYYTPHRVVVKSK